MRFPTSASPLFWGILALVLPAITALILWAVSLDKDYGLLLFAATVALVVPPALVAGIVALWKSSLSHRRRQAWVGLFLGLLATVLYVGGGVGFYLLLSSVLRHD